MVSIKVPIKVQKRSGFDKSHHNALTQKVGEIVPVLVDEVIPNTKIHLRFALAGSMPPLATDCYMKCYYDVRAFFVPMRLLFGGFESWFSDFAYPVVGTSGLNNNLTMQKGIPPRIDVNYSSDFLGILGAGTLADYLGYKLLDAQIGSLDDNVVVSALPFLAYHKVCNDWFRQPNITREFFAKPGGYNRTMNNATIDYGFAVCPFITYDSINSATFFVTTNKDDSCVKMADGVSAFDIRKANYDYDYFTNALPSAQLGNPMSVNTTGNAFTIAQLRSMNSLQQFAELNQLAGSKLVDVVKARYGANLSTGVSQRAIYLGGCRLDIGSKSVENNTGVTGNNVNNPFASVLGSTGGRAICQGTDLIVDNFVAQEPGYLFVVGTIIPKVTYGSGVRRYLRHYVSVGSITDMANPLLQNIGNQPIYDYEITGSLGNSSAQDRIFGYTDRYAEFMTMEDQVHGLMQSGQSLESFVAQRVFLPGDDPTINTAFLEVPSTALNNISAVGSQVSNYGFYGQFAFDYKVSQPLAQYSLPSLQNPAYEHGETIMVHRGGFRF